MNKKQKKAHVNLYIDKSFRDVADKDYIAARIVYQYGLALQFLWFSLQAIEKYLKAILLYNGYAITSSHNIYDIYGKVLKIPDIEFDFTKEIGEFIKDLGKNGANRYFEFPYWLTGDECQKLDKTVWYIRRYCKNIRGSYVINGKRVDRITLELEEIKKDEYKQKPNRYKINTGFLEETLKNKKSRLREQLVLNNVYYGADNKRHRKSVQLFSWAQPVHYMWKDLYQDLKDKVYFSKKVKERFEPKKD